MLIIKDFIDEFYNKTVFHGEKVLNSDLTPSQIKSLFAFEKDDHAYPIGELGKNARVKSSTMTDIRSFGKGWHRGSGFEIMGTAE